MDSTLLQVKDITKTFPGVKALDKVDLELQPGEIRALIGENGAGKSTLIKILAGIYEKDKGKVFFQGQKVQIEEPSDAKELGLSFIHQDVNLIPYFNAIENIWLGFNYPRKGITFNKKQMKSEVEELTKKLRFDLDLKIPVSKLSTANKWLVAILKAFMMDAKLLVLDEPTAALTDKEVKELFNNLRRIKEMGIGIIYISHRLEEILEIADSVTVLKNGEKVADENIEEVDKETLIKLMTGKKSLTRFPDRKNREKGETVLEINNLNGPDFQNINFNLKKNEVLGFFGLVGAGRTELMESIYGLRNVSKGEIILKEKRIKPKNPKHMIDKGVVLIPEDRREEGLVLNMGVNENVSLPNLEMMLKSKYLKNIDKNKQNDEAAKIVEKLNVKTPSLTQPVKYLSGGNQQKVVIGKWLYRETKVFIFDEPTVGIDVGARSEVYSLINNLTDNSGVIVVSSDLLEVMGICDRIAVMSQGKITGIIDKKDFSEDKILQLAYEEVE